ncbi:phosphatase PAP2 family protein [Streptomyces sp. NPDC001941]|uniref:phosphatase PAP2 family protein n=1 Tax=Streptomyces sp. NPDC001941 TaxID=3154659 RepID=UPI0033186F4D
MCTPTPPPPAPPVRDRALPVLAAALTGATLLLTVLVATGWSPLHDLDRSLADSLHRSAVAHPALTRANLILSDWVWDPVTMRALAAVTVLALWWRRERGLAIWFAVTTALAAALQQGLKSLIGRERPQWPDPVDSAQFAAYPSGHAMTATVTCGLLLWLLARSPAGDRVWLTGLTVAAVSVIGVGVTRLYLGVHWLTDVVGGWLLGALVVAVAAWTYERRTASSEQRSPDSERLTDDR